MPIANVCGSIPLPGGLGGFEAGLYFLYQTLSPASHGLVVALGYRIITLVIAGIGVVVYLVSRKDIKRLLEVRDEKAALPVRDE